MRFLEFLFGPGRDTAADLSEGEAALGLLVAAMKADGVIRPAERAVLAAAVTRLGLFPGEDELALEGRVARLDQLCEQHGKRALRDLASHVPEAGRSDLFSVCAEIMVADGRLVGEERRTARQLWEALGLPEAVASRLLGQAAASSVLRHEKPAGDEA